MRKDLGTTCLKEIQDQAPTATRPRRGLAILGLQELTVGNEVEIMLRRHVMRRLRRRPRFQLPPNRCALPANEPPYSDSARPLSTAFGDSERSVGIAILGRSCRRFNFKLALRHGSQTPSQLTTSYNGL